MKKTGRRGRIVQKLRLARLDFEIVDKKIDNALDRGFSDTILKGLITRQNLIEDRIDRIRKVMWGRFKTTI